MDLRLNLSFAAGKLVKSLTKHTGSGGTAAPGLLATKLDKNILRKFSKQLSKTLLITGTNGKTTTSRLVGENLSALEIPYLHNREGSNLERGLVATFLESANFSGKISSQVGVFEVDEAALALVIPKLAPTVIVIANLFRDQLDRYGEVDNIKRIWTKALANLDETTTLVLNADDPSVAFLGTDLRCKVIHFGLEDTKVALEDQPLAVDSIKCPLCFGDLKYELYYSSHQGKYSCPACGFKRPAVEISAQKIDLGSARSEFTLSDKDDLSIEVETKLPGLYNIYNCLASYTALKAADFPLDKYPLVLKKFNPVFGRGEFLEYKGKKLRLALAKNPSGFNEILRTFLVNFEGTVLLAINDRIADGRDVSWLWDVEFENITNQKIRFIVSGLRATDMALRLKYAGLKDVQVEENLEEAVELGLSQIPQADTLLVIPTYTAMLKLKHIFAKKGVGGEFWQD